MYSISESVDFVLESKPGISAYGQSGEKGLEGSIGTGFYYYNDSIAASTINGTAVTNILNKLVKYDSSVSCGSGDLILSKNGNLFLYNVSGSSHTLTFKKNIFTDETFPNFELSVTDVTVTNTSCETFSYIQENPYYMHDYSDTTSSNFIYHRDNYYRNVCGIWLKFSCEEPVGMDVDTTNFIYKFSVNFTNGKTISKVSPYNTDYIFMDVRYLTDCAPYYTSQATTGADTTAEGALSGIKTRINYISITNNSENSSANYKYYKTLFLRYVTAFSVDIINRESDKMATFIVKTLS